MDLTGAIWRKSTRSGNGGSSCVEVAKNLPDVVGVRDSKDQHGPALTFSPDAWQTFVRDVKHPTARPSRPDARPLFGAGVRRLREVGQLP